MKAKIERFQKKIILQDVAAFYIAAFRLLLPLLYYCCYELLLKIA